MRDEGHPIAFVAPSPLRRFDSSRLFWRLSAWFDAARVIGLMSGGMTRNDRGHARAVIM
jgi:hypothetical protein